MANRRSVRTELGAQFNEGARLLWKALAAREWSQGELQKRLTATRPLDGSKPRPLATGIVSRWLYGDRKPDIEHLVQIEKLFLDDKGVSEVPVNTWAKPASRPFVPPAARARTGTDG